ncbi:MAG: redox-regulated ATPase YchF [Patescibacteria group bacterium]|nr:redox-regulated ATPase YchF [Patescibacteria group bacterium]MDD5172699.1 redox-regulated ATPase YchF [Patescibacteria group bacterium]
MSLSIGIVGLPNVGKSTLFQTITKKQVDVANYPFCTIDPNIGVVTVPDKRVDQLVELEKSAKKIYTTIEFVDIAGLIKGASQGEGLGNQFLANIRETDALVYVLRFFNNENIVNTQKEINPLKEKEILDLELILKDLETINKRWEKLKKEARSGDKKIVKELEIITKAKKILEQEKTLFSQVWENEEINFLKTCQFLTFKPCLYLLNGEEKGGNDNFIQEFKKNNWPFLIIDILSELEAIDFSLEERESFGLSRDSELDILIKKTYQMLDLITFFTTGADETRAWTLKKGGKAPQAGGVIHTDFENYFIKAEVINWQTLINAGGFSQAKIKGLLRTEGKEYVVQDGDVIEIKSNV